MNNLGRLGFSSRPHDRCVCSRNTKRVAEYPFLCNTNGADNDGQIINVDDIGFRMFGIDHYFGFLPCVQPACRDRMSIRRFRVLR